MRPPRPAPNSELTSVSAGQGLVVGATGFEPVTPSVSGKCSPAELRARVDPIIRRVGCRCERVEAVPGIEPGYRVLQTLA
jgi:hypothetical protein